MRSLIFFLLGSIAAAPNFAAAQERTVPLREGESSGDLPFDATIDEIRIIGLHHIPEDAVRARISIHRGGRLNSTCLAADLRSLNRLGWFEDVSVEEKQIAEFDDTSPNHPAGVQLTFHVSEYPLLAAVGYGGSRILSEQQIRRLLESKQLSPHIGKPADSLSLHRASAAIQAELGAMGHPQSEVVMKQEKQPGWRVKVFFQVHDGPRLPVLNIGFSGHPEISESVLRKQMHEIVPNAWFSGFRKMDVFTPQKGEEDRVNLLTYLQDHGFPEARIGNPQIIQATESASHSLPWFGHQFASGLSVVVPVETGTFYNFGSIEVSAGLRERLGHPIFGEVTESHPYSQHAIQVLQRSWEVKLHRDKQRQGSDGTYRLMAVPTFNAITHTASVKFDFDPMPPFVVRRINFRGNERFPDRYLRRRIGLREGQPLDEYALQSGLARLARTGYFEPFKKEDVQIEAQEATRTADVIIHLHEKGRQRVMFSGGREQFGSTLGIAYTVFNLLGVNEFLSTHIDVGPETFELAMGFAEEGFLGSRGTLALSLFETYLRSRAVPDVQAPFQRTQTNGVNLGWSYATTDVDAIGINFGLSHTSTELVMQPGPGSTGQPADLRGQLKSFPRGWMDSLHRRPEDTDNGFSFGRLARGR